MPLTIRPAQPTDRDACLALLSQLGGPDRRPVPDGAAAIFDLLADRSRGAILVAVDGDIVLGMAAQSYNVAMRYGGEYAQLEELIVDPAARGRQAGARLVEAAIQAARTRGAAEYGLYLLAWTEHNRPFYEKFGLKAVGTEMRMRLTAAAMPEDAQ